MYVRIHLHVHMYICTCSIREGHFTCDAVAVNSQQSSACAYIFVYDIVLYISIWLVTDCRKVSHILHKTLARSLC